MPLLSTTKKIIQLLSGKVNAICRGNIGGRQRGFRSNRSATHHVFSIRQILEKKWEYNEALLQLSIDLKKAYDSVRGKVL